MELDEITENELLSKDYYDNQEYIGQNIKKSPSYKKWYENCLKKIKTENERRSKIKWHDVCQNKLDVRFLWIFYCPSCANYSKCSCTKITHCFVECNKCKTVFCPGCNFIQPKHGTIHTYCLKGFLRLWLLRVKYRRADLVYSYLSYYIWHVIVCVFITPLFLGVISFNIGLFTHSKKVKERKREELVGFYTILFGLLMFPYIITFIPIMALVLIPGIFNHNYYLHVFIAYVAVIKPGDLVIQSYYS